MRCWRRFVALRVLRGQFLLLLLALVLRVGFVIALPSNEFIPGPDQLLHDSLARSFLAGRGLSISADLLYPPDGQPEWVKKKFELYRELGGLWGLVRPGIPQVTVPPLNPLILALSYYLLGPGNLLVYRLIMALLGVATCWLVFDVARGIFGKRAALLALLVLAVYPALIYFSGVVLTETLFLFLFAAFINLIIRFRERPQLWLAALAGAVWTLGFLTKSTMAGMLPVGIVAILWPRRGDFRLKETLVLLVAIGLCLVPWVVRNYDIFGRVVIMPTKSWNLWERNNYRFNERFYNEEKEARAYEWLIGKPPFSVNRPETVRFPRFAPDEDEAQRNAKYVNLAKQFILANPGLYARLCLVRFIEFFRVLGRTRTSALVTVARLLSYGLILPLFVVGFVLSFRRSSRLSRQKWVLIAVVLLFVSVHVLTTAEPRYRLPIEPYMVAFASFFVVRAWDRIRARTARA
ncbi:MAG TPA: glycosyltransferase family 39 protein [bacterium]|nr:glycosyltransferase family 39 protein [bacterium]